MKVKSLSRVGLLPTPWTAAYQAPPSMGFSRQEYWSGVPLHSLGGNVLRSCLLFMATFLRSLDFPICTLIDLMLARPPRELLSILTGHEKNDLKNSKNKNPTNSTVACAGYKVNSCLAGSRELLRDRPWAYSETLF